MTAKKSQEKFFYYLSPILLFDAFIVVAEQIVYTNFKKYLYS